MSKRYGIKEIVNCKKVILEWEKWTCNEDRGLEKLEIGIAEAGSGGGATNRRKLRGTMRA